MTVVSALLTLLLLTSVQLSAEWPSLVFEQEIKIARSPDHVEDRAPFNNEPFVITITSGSGQFINAADVRFTWTYQGRVSAEGGYAFTRVNQSAMTGTIPGHPGGYIITYRIVAYDEKNTPLTSTQYSYTVVQNGSFSGNDFESNIELSWGPQSPKNYQSVQINISTRDPLVILARADLFYTVALPGQDPVDGVTFFSEGDDTVLMTATLIFYPPGSRISFHVEAYDSYMNRIVSPTVTYEYPELPPAQPVYNGFIFVQFRDATRRGTPDRDIPLTVTFSNATGYLFEMVAESGIAYTNRSVYQGTYRIEADYDGREYSWTISVPRPDGSFSFMFEINQKTYSVPYERERGPSWQNALGAGLMFLFVILSIALTNWVKKYYQNLAEDRKRRRKRDVEERPAKWYDSILKDEQVKDAFLKVGAFMLLSVAGLVWAPFYPWWMVLLLTAFISVLAIRFPYISLLLVSVLVTAAAAYQSREFGWMFLMLSLVTMIGGFFDWRYAYLTLLTVFATGFGLGFAVPMASALLISLFMGGAVLLTAGAFLLIIAPSGNFDLISLLASQGHAKSFVTFSRPIPDPWTPVDLANALSSITNVDMDTISTVLSDTMGTLVPFVGLLGWALAMIVAYMIFVRLEKGNSGRKLDLKGWALRTLPGLVLLTVGIITYVWASVEFNAFTIFAFASCILASILAFNLRGFGEESLPIHFGVEEVRSSDVGMKISEMVNFRKAAFNDIGGLEDVKREVKNALMVPLLEPEMATKYGVKPSKGILLFGPPGCGKTLMLRAVASDLNVDMIGIKCSDVMSKWYGESENLIASLFAEARARSPCILFLDEIDSIAKRRDFYSTDDVTPRVLSIMLSEMDGMDEAEGIIIVGTTNMPDLVDPALMRPGRFDKVIYIPPPDLPSREQIIKIHLKGKFAEKDIDTAEIARRSDGFSGADLANLVREASSLGLERALETKKPQPITQKDLMAVLDEIRPSVSPTMLKMYDKLRREFERKKGAKVIEGSTTPLEEGTEEEARKRKMGPKKGSRSSIEGEFEEVKEGEES